ncbi:MAG: Uma2 family endonuclease [Ferruginibacter sp.]|nr:Uma2 family endonuclease [Cytophagales bacterium]
MSENDTLHESRSKMQEWMANGCRLAWLIHPKQQKAYVYRPDGSVTEVDSFEKSLSGEAVLPGFVLELGLLK